MFEKRNNPADNTGRIPKPVKVPISLHFKPEIAEFPLLDKHIISEYIGGLISHFFRMSAEAAEDIVREAILDGKAEIKTDFPEIAESRVKLANHRMNTCSRLGEICYFARTTFNP